MKTCPCCRGEGMTRRVSGPKTTGTESWWIQEAPCMFCQHGLKMWEWENVGRLEVRETPKKNTQPASLFS